MRGVKGVEEIFESSADSSAFSVIQERRNGRQKCTGGVCCYGNNGTACKPLDIAFVPMQVIKDGNGDHSSIIIGKIKHI